MIRRLKMILPLLATACVLAACEHDLSPQEQQTAELGARAFADRSASSYVGCSGRDSDSDGYVTCSIKANAPPSTVTEVLCAYKGQPGCKSKPR